MANKRLCVSDFDGTWTDEDQGAPPFRVGFTTALARVVNLDAGELVARLAEYEKEIMAEPHRHAWVEEGWPVAPSIAGNYLRLRRASELLLDHLDRFPSPKVRAELFHGLFGDHYHLTRTVFRDGAGETLRALQSELDCLYVVTNAREPTVTHGKLRELSERAGVSSIDGSWLPEHVCGDARKHRVTLEAEGSTSLEATSHLSIPGLRRGVWLWRGHYFDVLNRLRIKHGVAWPQIRVVGDIFELDLALPFALGARVALLANEFTPPYELEFLSRQENARILRDIREIPAFFQE
ncbi:MAG: hypothetical protein AAB408_03435 [Patescibacteria group bacterium]